MTSLYMVNTKFMHSPSGGQDNIIYYISVSLLSKTFQSLGLIKLFIFLSCTLWGFKLFNIFRKAYIFSTNCNPLFGFVDQHDLLKKMLIYLSFLHSFQRHRYFKPMVHVIYRAHTLQTWTTFKFTHVKYRQQIDLCFSKHFHARLGFALFSYCI